MSDYDKEQWQAEEAAREASQTAYRDKMAKARERSASNAKRKIARLHAKLTELGHISDFEDEFGESVLERLEKYGSAFCDLEKGRAGDALSIAQKQVVARMNKKLKDLKAKQRAGETEAIDPDADYVRTADQWKTAKQKKAKYKKNGFKSKSTSKFKPRVRNIEDEMFEDEPVARPVNSRPLKPAPPRLATVSGKLQDPKPEPYIPEYMPPERVQKSQQQTRPSLRVVS